MRRPAPQSPVLPRRVKTHRGCSSLELSVREKGRYISALKHFHFYPVVISQGHFSAVVRLLFFLPLCLKVWKSNRNSKEICPLGERETDKMLSMYKVNKQTKKRNLSLFFSLFHSQLQQGAGFSEKCACFKSIVSPLDLKVIPLNIFFSLSHDVSCIFSL